MKRIAPLSVVGCFGLLFAASTCFAQAYKITDLGPLSPAGINTWGQVVGNYNNQAYLWTKRDGMRPLGTLAGGTFSRAAAINDLGMIAGTADGSGTAYSLSYGNYECSDLIQPFVWTHRNGFRTPPVVLDPWRTDVGPSCNFVDYATGINDLGQVVGRDGPLASYDWAFLWTSADGMTLFGGSFSPTMANAISNTSQIVGQNSIYGNSIGHATSWKKGVATDLGSLGGGGDVWQYASSANSVNDLGQVVGWSTLGPLCCPSLGVMSHVHAVLWTPSGAIHDLETLPGDTSSAASKINFFGLVIGSSGNTEYFAWDWAQPFEVVGRPFVWSERTGILDLNTLIPGNSGWVLNSATDINIWGQIVGDGTLDGQPHGFLLTPRTLHGF